MWMTAERCKQSHFDLTQRCGPCPVRGSLSLDCVDLVKSLRGPLVMLAAVAAPMLLPFSYCLCPFCNSYRPYCGNFDTWLC